MSYATFIRLRTVAKISCICIFWASVLAGIILREFYWPLIGILIYIGNNYVEGYFYNKLDMARLGLQELGIDLPTWLLEEFSKYPESRAGLALSLARNVQPDKAIPLLRAHFDEIPKEAALALSICGSVPEIEFLDDRMAYYSKRCGSSLKTLRSLKKARQTLSAKTGQERGQ